VVGATSPKSLNNSSVEFSPQGLGTSADPVSKASDDSRKPSSRLQLLPAYWGNMSYKILKNEIGSYSSFEVFSFVEL